MRTEPPEQQCSTDNARLQGAGGWEKFPLFWFVLFLSYTCTRRCSYCYAFNQVGDTGPVEMDETAFSRLLEWISEVWRANGVKVNLINFLGGEPLMRTDRIRRVMDAVRKNTNGVQGLVNTNGDLVDSVNWDDLEEIQPPPWPAQAFPDAAGRDQRTTAYCRPGQRLNFKDASDKSVA